MADYFMGLDLGTGSLGWAVTDKEYEIMRAHGKALWGVRLFDSANTAEERRSFRTARRRLDRRNWRIELLQQLFDAEVSKVDPGFFLRMKESKYVPEDKRDSSGNCPELPYALFVDDGYTDKDYHRQFPTIYHLRKWLMNTDETPDICLVYLALHHMMKHRGHFLFSGSIENIKEFQDTFMQYIRSIMDEELDFELCIVDEELQEIENVLKDSRLTRSAKKTRLVKLLGAKTACEKAVLNLVAGGTVKLSDIFGNSELDSSEKPKICFTDASYDEYAAMVEEELGEQYVIIEMAKAVYDWSVLTDILGDYCSISDAKVAVYEKHQKDLRYLKNLVKDNLGKDIYKEIFVKTGDKLQNYSAYIGMTKKNGIKSEIEGKRCDRKEFYDYLKKTVVNAISDEEKTEYLRTEMETETFLPRQVTKENGVIPHQVHLYELDAILKNLCERIPVLKENGGKIRDIFTFRIPYYVGPLNGVMKGGEKTNWVKRKQGKIYPWNFNEMVDTEESAERFIRRMTSKCTYLIHEDVLPKNSMLYSKFMVLNELNNVRLNGVPIDVELKQRIYEDLFQRHRKVTQKRLFNYLVKEGIADRNADITGIDGDFKGTLTAYHDFKEKLTGCRLSQEDKENIILNITLFGEDKSLLMKRLEKLYPELTKPQKKAICSLSYKGWGRLSRKFLEGITTPAPGADEVWTIIRTLWETNDNMMQALSDKYNFADAVDKENAEDETQEITYKTVEQMNVSPAVKRQIWQTLQVIREIYKVMGEPPKRVFVEMAREKSESKRTESRKKRLVDLYKKCKEEERDWIKELGNTEETTLRSDKLYLYYTQKGRCMYSGEAIELGELWDNRKYDIDHIYPQSRVMDDSLDNRVLVKKEYNADKGDEFPIRGDIREKMRPFWHMLTEGGFISKEKYKRLTRGTRFEPSELSGFIARQLVETRQSTKAVASVLKQIFPETKIVYAKAKAASRFRQDFDLIKVREMNDLHHAKDAYINIVVGNVYYTKFTNDAWWYVKEYPKRSYNLKRMFTSDQDVSRDGEVAWRAGNAGTIATVKRVMGKNNILVTRRSYQAKGGLFDQQPLKRGKGQVPLKGSDERLENVNKYGGYGQATRTHFMLVESEGQKGLKKRSVESIPLYLCDHFEKDEELVKQYLETDCKLNNPSVLISKIKVGTLFKVDGFFMWLATKSGNQLVFKGANQLILGEQDARILKKVIKYVNRRKINKNAVIDAQDGLNEMDLIELYDVFLDKIKNSVYHIRLNAPQKILTNKRDVFLYIKQ